MNRSGKSINQNMTKRELYSANARVQDGLKGVVSKFVKTEMMMFGC